MADDDRRDRRETSETIRLVVIGLLVVALVGFVLDNTDDVAIEYVFGDTDAPLIVVLVATAVIGAVIGWLIRRARRN
ncbi:MAG: lipopolysaccharide assembly protein LapA domain-containing protein [Actinomycetota bacterium]